MGSSFAGIKAGIIAGIFFAGSTGLFNYLMLVGLKASVLTVLAQTPDCSGVISTNSTRPLEDCFSALTSVLVPLGTILIFIATLISAFLFGRLFERIPTKSYLLKAVIVSYLMILALLFFGFEGISANESQRLYLVLFELASAAGFAYILATFYKRYTRLVEFSSPGSDPVKIMLGRKKNVTGKTITLSTRSSHKIVADTSGTRVFKEWSFSGGVSVEDPKSYETVMRVDGDGMLRAYSATAN